MKYHPRRIRTDRCSFHNLKTFLTAPSSSSTFLKRNAIAIAVSSGGLRMMPSMAFADSNYTPSAWPVMGHITDGFGERLDPFSGEARSTPALTWARTTVLLCTPTADGVVLDVGQHSGYGPVVILDHGFGINHLVRASFGF